ncbi:MAG: glycosyltransferase family 4 protein [Actinomycetota bacterium]|nr:glycosyltransferase family 4 protein [Actinomycetota bacterium]
MADPVHSGAALRVGFDATPLLGARTGVGTYVQNLCTILARRDDLCLRAVAFSLRGRAALAALPNEVRVMHRPVPGRLLRRAWLRCDVPPAEWLTGRVDVVHGTNFVLPPPRSARGVVTVHDLAFLHYPELVDAASLAYRTLVPRAVARAAVVVTVSQAMAEEISTAYRVPPERLAVTEIGVHQSWFEPAPRVPGVPGDYILAVGTLEPRKGLDVLVAAYRDLLAADPSAPSLVLVGPPGWGASLDLSGIPSGRVVLPGYADAQTLRGLMQHARLLAFPTRYEGFGLPPLEALAAGTAVVASDLPVVREVVGPHARLVPVGDVAALAAAISATLAEDRPADAVAAARAHAATFTWERCAAKTVAAYHRAAR